MFLWSVIPASILKDHSYYLFDLVALGECLHQKTKTKKNWPLHMQMKHLEYQSYSRVCVLVIVNRYMVLYAKCCSECFSNTELIFEASLFIAPVLCILKR